MSFEWNLNILDSWTPLEQTNQMKKLYKKPFVFIKSNSCAIIVDIQTKKSIHLKLGSSHIDNVLYKFDLQPIKLRKRISW